MKHKICDQARNMKSRLEVVDGDEEESRDPETSIVEVDRGSSLTKQLCLPVRCISSICRGITDNFRHSLHECALECTPDLKGGGTILSGLLKVEFYFRCSNCASEFSP